MNLRVSEFLVKFARDINGLAQRCRKASGRGTKPTIAQRTAADKGDWLPARTAYVIASSKRLGPGAFYEATEVKSHELKVFSGPIGLPKDGRRSLRASAVFADSPSGESANSAVLEIDHRRKPSLAVSRNRGMEALSVFTV
jgi:hypothetical protein